jgi:DNA polymerase III delta prime subunit
MSKLTTGWYKIYRPKSIEDYIFQNQQDEEKIRQYIESGDFPDLLLFGHRGTGKTTLAQLLKHELKIDDLDVLFLNASDDNSVDDARHKIKPFINTLSVGKFRLVVLDEADALTTQAQEALKSMMEEEDYDARFILICNKINKIIPEIRSRCTEYAFNGFDRTEMIRIALTILENQGMNLKAVDNQKELLDTLNAHLEYSYPDLRKFITSIEQRYDGEKVLPPMVNEIEMLVELIMMIDAGNWKRIRDIVYQELPDSEIVNVYRFLNSNIQEIDKFKNEESAKKAVIILAHYASLHGTVAIPELNLLACLTKLCDL